MRTWISVFALAAFALGCSGNGGSSGSGSGSGSTGGASSGSTSSGGGSTGSTGNVACTITASGAVTKTASCEVSAAGDSSNANMIITSGGEFAFAMYTTAALAQQGYDVANARFTASVVENSGQQTWTLDTNDGGAGQVDITSLSVTAQAGDSKQYEVHGTASATVPPGQGNTSPDDVTLNITF